MVRYYIGLFKAKLMRWVVFCATGVFTSIAMLIAALRLNINIAHPYIVWVASFVVLETVFVSLAAARKQLIAPKAMRHILLDAIMFALGAWFGFYAVISIYPPNL